MSAFKLQLLLALVRNIDIFERQFRNLLFGRPVKKWSKYEHCLLLPTCLSLSPKMTWTEMGVGIRGRHRRAKISGYYVYPL